MAHGQLWDPFVLTIEGVEDASLVDAPSVIPVATDDQELAVGLEGVSRAKEIYVVALGIFRCVRDGRTWFSFGAEIQDEG